MKTMTDAEIVAHFNAYMTAQRKARGMTDAEARELQAEKDEERTRDYADLSDYRNGL